MPTVLGLCGAAGMTATVPPGKCTFHVPDPTAPSRYGREQNWLAVERWANTILPDCFCHHCYSTGTWAEDCRLHIPHPSTDDPDEEAQNWLELERWAVRLKACYCQASADPMPPPE